MPHAWLRRGSTTALATLLVAAPATMASADPGDGIGDPYFPSYGNTGYDVEHYDLDLDYTPKNDTLQGTATLDAEATEDLDAFTLDFLLDVESVEVNGEKADHKKSGEHKVQVTPAAPVAKGEPLTVVVKYSGVPSKAKWDGATGVGWHRTEHGAVVMGEPEAAPWWFPANDHPRDKATLDVRATVPKGTQAIGNGVLADESDDGDTTTFTWKQDKPAATYLATLAIGKYEVTTGETADGVPIYNAYSDTLDPNQKKRAKDSVEKGAEIIDFESGVFGPYPYNALGGIVEGADPEPELGGALETQTRPVYSNAFFEDQADSYVVAHELAHQWWGDQVSVDRWQDIWLNEGFASYAEWMWSEDQGQGTAQELADKTYDAYPADDDFWQVKPGDPGPENVFHPAVYDRGALAVHALRTEVGDDAFFDILATWQEDNAHGNARIEDFMALSEKISGQQLDELFDTWLYTTGKPEAGTGAKPAVSAKPESADPKSWQTIHDNHQRMAEQHG